MQLINLDAIPSIPYATPQQEAVTRYHDETCLRAAGAMRAKPLSSLQRATQTENRYIV